MSTKRVTRSSTKVQPTSFMELPSVSVVRAMKKRKVDHEGSTDSQKNKMMDVMMRKLKLDLKTETLDTNIRIWDIHAESRNKRTSILKKGIEDMKECLGDDIEPHYQSMYTGIIMDQLMNDLTFSRMLTSMI